MTSRFEISKEEGPYAVVCREHGQQFLTEGAYLAQLERSNDRWFCPVCGDNAAFDDLNLESYIVDEERFEGPGDPEWEGIER
jgi:hypothetical protein